jgi:hypothetical protein
VGRAEKEHEVAARRSLVAEGEDKVSLKFWVRLACTGAVALFVLSVAAKVAMPLSAAQAPAGSIDAVASGSSTHYFGLPG